MHVELFRDRSEAGRKLAKHLAEYENEDALVLAIPRGGVPVGYEIAGHLHIPFDIIVPRKLPIPWNPEAGFGAVTADGTMVLNHPMVRSLGLREDEISSTADEVRQEIIRRTQVYRGDRPMPDLKGRAVILVDDGLASGYTMLAAIESVRKYKPSTVIVAVPVASSGAARMIAGEVDKFVAMIVSERLPFAVASFYALWRDLSDEEVQAYLESKREESDSAA
ncbi:MAG TPA: phosphoribosyltransferase family protein [Armatimonadota bacterium]|jgi:putative phosphoribosyl transferase